MRKFKNLFTSLFMAGTMALSCTFNINAATKTNTKTYYSPQMTAGEWWSAYDDDTIASVDTGISGNVSGGDVGVVFRKAGVGLPEGFHRTTSRSVNIQLKENDTVSDNELVGKYYAEFHTDTYTGYYQPDTYSRMYTGDVIETNSEVELYIRALISIHGADTSTAVPEWLIPYYFVVYG